MEALGWRMYITTRCRTQSPVVNIRGASTRRTCQRKPTTPCISAGRHWWNLSGLHSSSCERRPKRD